MGHAFRKISYFFQAASLFSTGKKKIISKHKMQNSEQNVREKKPQNMSEGAKKEKYI